jgi:single-strand selective monofunctional uracil DNA glycosylase
VSASRVQACVDAAKQLSVAVDALKFSPPISHVYNPLNYAWAAYEQYLQLWAQHPKRVLFLGMNPGPFGMAQVGVPFGEVSLVRDWIGIDASIQSPENPHPKRPIEGFGCTRSEVSGRRLWGLFREEFVAPAAFFEAHLVLNYCPLVFMEASGRNRTPDKLAADERSALFQHCDLHLRSLVESLEAEVVVGVGAFAEQRAQAACTGLSVQIIRILHPSPASPAANRGWGAQAKEQLQAAAVW